RCQIDSLIVRDKCRQTVNDLRRCDHCNASSEDRDNHKENAAMYWLALSRCTNGAGCSEIGATLRTDAARQPVNDIFAFRADGLGVRVLPEMTNDQEHRDEQQTQQNQGDHAHLAGPWVWEGSVRFS